MSDYLSKYVTQRVSAESHGMQQFSLALPAAIRERTQYLAGVLRVSESELMRAMIESGLIDLEKIIEEQDVKPPTKRTKK